MRALLLYLFFLAGNTGLHAQDSTLITIKTGSRIKDVLTPADILLYPKFIQGTVFFKSGIVASAKMNYNSLSDQMLFIDDKGDTLALNEEKTVSMIALGPDTFYYFNGYIRLVANNDGVKLAEKKTWEVADRRKIGSHNRQATGYAVSSFSSITDDLGRTYELILDEDLLLRKKPHYFFGDTFNTFIPAGKKNLLSFFPKKEDVLSIYLRENKVNFSKKDDLEKIVQFLAQN